MKISDVDSWYNEGMRVKVFSLSTRPLRIEISINASTMFKQLIVSIEIFLYQRTIVLDDRCQQWQTEKPDGVYR